MITMITGGPGLGKTALAVSMLLDEYKDRPIFTNINGLTLDHSPLPKLDEWTEEVANDQGTTVHRFTFPPGAVIVIDECQQFFRPRATGSKVPPYITAFETHRHQGLDFVLITQGTRLVDSNLRSLVKGGRHIFLKSSYIGRFRYEKSEAINEDDRASYTLAAKRKYTLPKKAFHLYKSSELHTKPPRPKIPLAAYLIVGAVVVGAYLAYHTSSRIGGALQAEKQPPASIPATVDAQRPQLAGVVVEAKPSFVEATTPLDPHDPLSAPLYENVKPTAIPPVVEVCIASRSRCVCYSQQQTPVWMPDEQCRQRAAGLYYDPYRQPSPEGQTQPQHTTTQESPGGLARGFDSVTEPDAAPEAGQRPDAPPSGAGGIG